MDDPRTSDALHFRSLVSTDSLFILQYQKLFAILELTREFIWFIYTLVCVGSDDIVHCNIGKVFQIYIIQQRIVQKETNDIMQIQSISDAKR